MAEAAGEVRINVADIPVGGMAQGGEGDRKALFVRDGDGVRAFQATCPHYGAPLAKGMICGRTLYCPWHKAAFDIADGSLREPPALDHLKRFPVRVEGEEAVATLQPIERPVPEPVGAERHVVIVGTGAGGVAAATTLRREGFAGRITMVGREDAQPYDRPKLSKNFLAKKTPLEAMLLEKDFYRRLDIVPEHGPAEAIDVASRGVVLADGRRITADALIVATGSRAKRISCKGDQLDNVFALRSLADAEAISEAAEKGAKRVVAIGSGFISLEAAAFLTKRGLSATVLSPEELPFAKRFGDAVARAIKSFHEGNGIRFVQGEVAGFGGTEKVSTVELKDGSTLQADFVLVGAGAAPETEAFTGIERRDDGGISVGGDLAVAPAVWIAGDIAAFPEVRTGVEARIEHWRLAEQHGIHAARAAMREAGQRSEPFANAPFFWSNQGDKRLDYAGYAPDWDEIVMEGDPEALDFIAFYVKGGEAHGACAIGKAGKMIAYLNRLESGRAPTRAELASL